MKETDNTWAGARVLVPAHLHAERTSAGKPASAKERTGLKVCAPGGSPSTLMASFSRSETTSCARFVRWLP
jgi:hypothetical protein